MSRARINNYEVVVGNIGHVYRGHLSKEARSEFNFYVSLIKRETGRAEAPVTWIKNGEIFREYGPSPIEVIAEWTKRNPDKCEEIVSRLAAFLLLDPEDLHLLADSEPFISGADFIDETVASFEAFGLYDYLKSKL